MKRRFQKGLTLIEFLIVTVVIGVLAAIGIVQLIYAKERALQASTIANMHSFQNSVEVYAVDFGGLYPDDLADLLGHLPVNEPLLKIPNPQTAITGQPEAIDEESSATKKPYVVTFESFISQYYIYGYNKQGQRIIKNGSDFVLSNG